jgi:IclR family acetate operon transcriptional repressor
MTDTSERYQIQSVERALDMITIISETERPLTFTEIIEMTGLPKSSTFLYLSTMVNRGYFVIDPIDSTYRIGPGFPMGSNDVTEAIKDLATPIMHKLSVKLGETVNLGVLAGLTIKYIKVVESPRHIRASSRIGSRDSLHCTALGKVILSKFESKELSSILKAIDFTARTSRTILTVGDLKKEVQKIKVRGYAIDDLENDLDCRCVAVNIPISGQNLALSVSAPSSRFPLNQVSHVAGNLIETVNELVEASKVLDSLYGSSR